MSETQNESILLLAAEGGAFHFFRQQRLDGRYSFFMKSVGCSFLMSDFARDLPSLANGQSRSETTETFETMEDAVQSSFPDGIWVFFQPLEIHTDYKQVIWHLRKRTVQARGNVLPETDVWQSTCFSEC